MSNALNKFTKKFQQNGALHHFIRYDVTGTPIYTLHVKKYGTSKLLSLQKYVPAKNSLIYFAVIRVVFCQATYVNHQARGCSEACLVMNVNNNTDVG